MLKIYLETTMFNYYFDKDRGTAHEYTRELFRFITAGRFLGYTSEAVTKELGDALLAKAQKMLALIAEYNITVLPKSNAAEKLADVYVNHGVIPRRFRTDGLHLAIAAVNKLDMLVSMNCRHIVKPKTITMTEQINKDYGYKAVKLLTPEEVIKNA